MTQEDKELLLKDLCARLPFRLSIQATDFRDVKTNGVLTVILLHKMLLGDVKVKPYLRPMSCMTEEEAAEMVKLHIDDRIASKIEICDANCIDFYNLHYLDYRGLIEKGLALEAPEGMYKTE